MFTGIIEMLGTVDSIEISSEGKEFRVKASFKASDPLKLGDSISINGVCTTLTAFGEEYIEFYVAKESLAITNLDQVKKEERVNLERSLSYGGRIDGHLVYGHVDEVVEVKKIIPGESTLFQFPLTTNGDLIIRKGSVALNGISLTVHEVGRDYFQVMIIPHTMEHTVMQDLRVGSLVNIEYDAYGKYLKKFYHQKGSP